MGHYTWFVVTCYDLSLVHSYRSDTKKHKSTDTGQQSKPSDTTATPRVITKQSQNWAAMRLRAAVAAQTLCVASDLRNRPANKLEAYITITTKPLVYHHHESILITQDHRPRLVT
jgi:hypothetical protein